MGIEWSGPTGGLGNRMLALASASALSGLLGEEIGFTWDESDACPCRFGDLFSDIEGLREGRRAAGHTRRAKTCGWHPVRIRKGFEKALKVRTREDEYYYAMIRALRNFGYSDTIETDLAECRKNRGGKAILSVHLRRGDRYEHHRRVYRHHVYAFNIIRNTGYRKSLQYLLLPETRNRKNEYEDIRRRVTAHLKAYPGGAYTLYGDSKADLNHLNGFLAQSGIPAASYAPGFCSRREEELREAHGIRDTHPREALVELLEMATGHGIVQNNPASTFSLVAAIIGRVRINSRQPSHAFWLKIRKVLGAAPNEIVTEDETLSH
jgi:hypothetical protein